MTSWHCAHLPLEMESDKGCVRHQHRSATRQTAWRATHIAAAKVGRYIRGEKLVNVTNREEVGDHA
jgi:hypothetical protein